MFYSNIHYLYILIFNIYYYLNIFQFYKKKKKKNRPRESAQRFLITMMRPHKICFIFSYFLFFSFLFTFLLSFSFFLFFSPSPENSPSLSLCNQTTTKLSNLLPATTNCCAMLEIAHFIVFNHDQWWSITQTFVRSIDLRRHYLRSS